MKLSLLTMMILTACAASQSRLKTPWRIEVVTSGGFAGRGNGNYAIDSEGKVTITSMSGRVCTFEASDEELAKFENLVASAKPAQWKESYIPENPCCDRFQYDLTFEQDGTKRTTRWVDDPDPMPPDLAAIADALTGADSLRVRYQERCR